jgi:hypothetical protein
MNCVPLFKTEKSKLQDCETTLEKQAAENKYQGIGKSIGGRLYN